LDTPAVEEGVLTDEDGIGPFARKRCEGGINLTDGAGFEDLDLQPGGTCHCVDFSQRAVGIVSIDRIYQDGHTSGCRHQLVQELQPFPRQLGVEKIDSGQVAARPGEAGDKTKPDRVLAGDNAFIAALPELGYT
jgi:hypothetical protein